MPSPLMNTLIGSGIGAVFGSVATGGVGYLLYRRKEGERADKLQKALRAEISGMYIFDNLEMVPEEGVPHEGVFSTVVFDNNSNRMGLLPEPLRGEVIRFYSFLKLNSSMIEEYR